MIVILVAAFLSGTPAITAPESGFAGDLVATWAYEDSKAHIAISLDADGGCSVVRRSRSSGELQRRMCAYCVVGSTVHLRMKNPEGRGPRFEIALAYDQKADELISPGDASMRFARASLTERSE